MLRHVGSCRTFVTGQLFVGGTVKVAVLARGEADGILLRGQLRLTISGAKEHEQLEDKQEVSANNSVQTEPSLPTTPRRITRDVPELWDHGQVTMPTGGTSARLEWNGTGAGGSMLSRRIPSYDYNCLNLTPHFSVKLSIIYTATLPGW